MRIAMAGLLTLVLCSTPLFAHDGPAKKLFGAKVAPAAIAPEPVGSYAKGCLAGGEALAWNGPNHQVMRLSRNRYWGHPVMIDYLGRLGAAAREEGWHGLMVGDMAQPRGGPMLTGHAGNQIGLDADIWLRPMPDHLMSDEERENVSAVSMLNGGLTEINRERWTATHGNLIGAAASSPEVARIFAHPVIKRELCETAGDDRAWLRKIRPWWGHHYHFHVRLSCPDGAPGCIDQAVPPPGDGCGKELSSWFKAAAKPKTPPPPRKKKPDLVLADLPSARRTVLDAPWSATALCRAPRLIPGSSAPTPARTTNDHEQQTQSKSYREGRPLQDRLDDRIPDIGVKVSLDHRLRTIEAGAVKVVPALAELGENEFACRNRASPFGNQETKTGESQEIPDETKYEHTELRSTVHAVQWRRHNHRLCAVATCGVDVCVQQPCVWVRTGDISHWLPDWQWRGGRVAEGARLESV